MKALMDIERYHIIMYKLNESWDLNTCEPVSEYVSHVLPSGFKYDYYTKFSNSLLVFNTEGTEMVVIKDSDDMRMTFKNETPETSDVVLCDYCGETLHSPEDDIFWKDTQQHNCEKMKIKEAVKQARKDAFMEAAEVCDTTQFYDFNEKGAVALIRQRILGLVEKG